ncbi:MAG: tRNA (adenosine(37)-N6)-threonylcarbamoyltransferase complex ATPase subunit type 1 TsaE [Chthoniobacterales bacterium]|nr:tRNA (adenosine(37)-N6)-threonylcarbamoyltransferase complex ATPase subunit type 1 TsaE [Chthoniobacterales bacterium]
MSSLFQENYVKPTNSNNLLIAHSIEETQVIAQQLLSLLKENGVISLEGPLGAGKTHFAKGIAAAFHLEEEVTSPTFTLLQTYGPRERPLHHIDFYRLNTEEEALDLGLEECFEKGITIIEWGNKFLSLLPKGTLRIALRPLDNDAREISWHVHD